VTGKPAPRSNTAKHRVVFLEYISQCWSATHAARVAGVYRQRMYELRDQDEAFAAEWEDAYERGSDAIEDELHRRAVGYDEETRDGDGIVIRTVRRYSDQALIALARARRPERFRDNARVELTGKDGGAVTLVDRSASLAGVAAVLMAACALNEVVEVVALEALQPALEEGS